MSGISFLLQTVLGGQLPSGNRSRLGGTAEGLSGDDLPGLVGQAAAEVVESAVEASLTVQKAQVGGMLRIFQDTPSPSGSVSAQTTKGTAAPRAARLDLPAGAEVQAKVIGQEGELELLSLSGQTVRAAADERLPMGALVKLRVLEPGLPLKAQVLSISLPKAQPGGDASQSVIRLRGALLNLAPALASVSEAAATSVASGLPGTLPLQKMVGLLRALAQGGTPDPEKIQAAVAFFNPASEESGTPLEALIAKVMAPQSDKMLTPVPAGSTPAPPAGSPLQAGAEGAGPASAPGLLAGQTKAAVEGAPGEGGTGSGQGATVKTPTSTGPQEAQAVGFKPDAPAAPGSSVPRVFAAEILPGGDGNPANAPKNGTQAEGGGVSPKVAPFFVSEAPPAPAGTAGPPASTFAQTGVAASSGASAPTASPPPAAEQGGVAGGPAEGRAPVNALTNFSQPGERPREASFPERLGPPQASKAEMPPVSSREAAPEPPMGDARAASQDAQPSVHSGRAPVQGVPVEGSARSDLPSAAPSEVLRHEPQTASQTGATTSPHPQTAEATASDAVKTAAQHLQSVQQFQQQIQQRLDGHFFVVPFWFEWGDGVGYWTGWREEQAPAAGGDRGAIQHLVFDLHMTALGPVKIHLAHSRKGLQLHMAARRQALPVLRRGTGELRQALSDLGLNWEHFDLFALEDSDLSEFQTPGEARDVGPRSLHVVI